MQLTQNQVNAVQQERENVYVRCTVEFYRKHHANFVRHISNRALEQRVRAALLRAHALRISDQYSLTIYVNLVVLAGPDILSDEKISSLIEMEDENPNAQVKRLARKVIGYLETLKKSQVAVAGLPL